MNNLIFSIRNYNKPSPIINIIASEMQEQQKDDITSSIIKSLQQAKSQSKQLEQQLQNSKQVLAELLSSPLVSKACPKGHPLRYLHNPKSLLSALYFCNNCSQRCNNVSTIRWNCSQCNFDLCVKCGGYRRNICPYLHLINGRRLIQAQKEKRICDICLKPIHGMYFGCGCGFDVCEKCKESKPEQIK